MVLKIVKHAYRINVLEDYDRLIRKWLYSIYIYPPTVQPIGQVRLHESLLGHIVYSPVPAHFLCRVRFFMLAL